jgi:hypothetical protein
VTGTISRSKRIDARLADKSSRLSLSLSDDGKGQGETGQVRPGNGTERGDENKAYVAGTQGTRWKHNKLPKFVV